MIVITIKNLQKKVSLKSIPITGIVKKILRHEGVSQAELSLVFVTDHIIRKLNKTYLKKDYPTDVLAFDFGQRRYRKAGSKMFRTAKSINGEIVVSTDMAGRNAKSYRTTRRQELILYVLHGLLHLLGFNDHAPIETKRMRQKEEELLRIIPA